MNVVLCEGRVRIECPECGDLRAISRPSDEIHCLRCKYLISYNLGMTDMRFAALNREARITVFRRIS